MFRVCSLTNNCASAKRASAVFCFFFFAYRDADVFVITTVSIIHVL
jgi:hypothetical protein